MTFSNPGLTSPCKSNDVIDFCIAIAIEFVFRFLLRTKCEKRIRYPSSSDC